MTLAIGTRVRVLSPFDTLDGAEDCTIGAVQFIGADGAIVEAETGEAQYLLAGGALDGMAIHQRYLEVIA